MTLHNTGIPRIIAGSEAGGDRTVDDQTRIPIAHQVFSGSLHDTKTFDTVIEDLKKRFSVRKVILVGDRGMVSEANLEQIRTLDMEYVVGDKLRKSQQAQGCSPFVADTRKLGRISKSRRRKSTEKPMFFAIIRMQPYGMRPPGK